MKKILLYILTTIICIFTISIVIAIKELVHINPLYLCIAVVLAWFVCMLLINRK